MPSITVVPVTGSRGIKRFIRVAYAVHQQHPLWVAPLDMDQRKTLAPTYPFFEHGEGQLFVAVRDGRDVGRISAQINHAHREKFGDGAGFFGWFECFDDAEAAAALFAQAAGWLKDRGCRSLRGPFNWDINGEATGVLVEDLEPGLPMMLMPWSPSYYQGLLEGCGFSKVKDLYAWRTDEQTETERRMGKLLDSLSKRIEGFAMRELDTGKGYRADMEQVRTIYNEAWADNWGATPLTAGEMSVIAGGLKMIVNPRLTRLVSVKGEAVGCFVCIPNVNPILHRLRGRLLPFGWLRLLRGAKKVHGIRTFLMGVRPAFRGRGIESVMIADVMRVGRPAGINHSELSWVLEDNVAMNSLAAKIGHHYRTYRVYEKLIGSDQGVSAPASSDQ